MIKRRTRDVVMLIVGVALVALALEGCGGKAERRVQFSRSPGKTRVAAGKKTRRPAPRHAFIWPVDEFTFMSPYGMRRGRRHEGIDLAAPSGTPIKAAAAGKVVFSGRMRGYGNLVLIKHDKDFFTAYAHNRKNLASKGAVVKQGQLIAQVGRTGRATGNHLHFEIRKGAKAIDPLGVLPAQAGVLVKNTKVSISPAVASAAPKASSKKTSAATRRAAKTSTAALSPASKTAPSSAKRLAVASPSAGSSATATQLDELPDDEPPHPRLSSREIEEVLLKEMVLPEKSGAMTR